MAEKRVKIVAVIDGETAGYKGAVEEMEGKTKDSGKIMEGIWQGVGQQITRAFVDVGRWAARQLFEAVGWVKDQLVDSVQYAAKFESALAEAASLGVKDIEPLRAGMIDLSARIGQDLVESTRGLYQALSAGVPEENVIDFLGTASELAVAGVTDVETAVDGLTSTLNSYRFSYEAAGEVSDKFFTAVRLGKTTVGELAAYIGRVTPVAAQMGVELDEVLGVLVSATRAGIATHEAMTGLKAALNNIMNPTSEAQKIFAAMGLTVEDVGNRVREGGLIEFLRQLTPEQLKEVIGSIEGLNVMLATIGNDGGAQFMQFLGEIQNSTGATADAMAIMEETASFQFNKMLQTVRNFGVEAVQPFLEWATDALQIINERFAGPLLRDVAPIVKYAVEEWFEGPSGQRALEIIGSWADRAIDRMIGDLERNIAGEISFGEMVGGWIRDSAGDIHEDSKDLLRQVGEALGRILIEGVKAASKIAWEEYKNWWLESFMGWARWQEGILNTPATGSVYEEWKGAMGFQGGGIVPGIGSGDIVPALLEPGELVIPREMAGSGN